MPEFEESSPQSNPEHTYTPSTDAKPRTRRRSGGFKKEHDSAPKGNMGEVDAAEALKSEKLSGSGKPSDTSEAAPKRERREPRERREREPRNERSERAPRGERKERAPRPARDAEPKRETNPQPSPETLAAIALVEDRITARKAERDARHEERKKARAAEKAAKPVEVKKPANKKAKAGGKRPAKKKGLIASILSLFGLGPKEPAKKPGGNRKGGRPQGGNRGGQNRQGGNRGGQNRGRGGKGRGGQNRRRGQGGGQNRRPQSANREG